MTVAVSQHVPRLNGHIHCYPDRERFEPGMPGRAQRRRRDQVAVGAAGWRSRDDVPAVTRTRLRRRRGQQPLAACRNGRGGAGTIRPRATSPADRPRSLPRHAAARLPPGRGAVRGSGVGAVDLHRELAPADLPVQDDPRHRRRQAMPRNNAATCGNAAASRT